MRVELAEGCSGESAAPPPAKPLDFAAPCSCKQRVCVCVREREREAELGESAAPPSGRADPICREQINVNILHLWYVKCGLGEQVVSTGVENAAA